MRKQFLWLACAVVLFLSATLSWHPVHATKLKNETANTKADRPGQSLLTRYVEEIYETAQLSQAGLSEPVFRKAITGFVNLKMANMLPENSSVITVVDFTLPSYEKRMWIVDLLTKRVLINTWVAHGQGSGNVTADYFSNIDDSHQSSLGFYLTDNVYIGKHGRSLHLDGLDEGFNDLARAREIVVHAAPYVSERTINATGRIGCSWGCPAVSPQISNKVINTIQGHTMFFINGNDESYTSKYLNEDNISASYLFPELADNHSNG